MTNYEKIKRMSLEEMADFLADDFNKVCADKSIDECDTCIACSDCYTKWLESEAEE